MGTRTADSSLAPAESRRLSSAARVFGAYYAPTPTLEDIARDPHFILAWVVIILCGLLFSWTCLQRIGADNLAQQLTAKAAAAGRPLTPEQLARLAQLLPLQFLLLPVVLVPITLLILAGIFLALENFLLGQQVRYKAVLGVVSHSWLPLSLAALAGTAVLWLRPDPASVQFPYVLGSNPAFYFAPHALSAPMTMLLGKLDLFTFWSLGLLALGLSKIGHKLKFTTTLPWVGGLWIAYVLISVGVAAL